MKISYAITVCNEIEEIKRLIPFLLQHKRPQDEICVLLDKPKASTELINLLYIWSAKDYITLKESTFQGHFADWKNELTRMCKGDYIFNIDADEIPCTLIIEALPGILSANNGVDMIWVPRVNTVEGMDQDHMQQWGWNVNGEGWINWPDWQGRIYRNHPSIQWENKVHEKLTGIKTFAQLPMEEDYSLYHAKTIERQIKQNTYYETL